jgi:hypothetical protein
MAAAAGWAHQVSLDLDTVKAGDTNLTLAK